MPDAATTFNTAYWLHQPKEVRALRDVPSIDNRAALAESLAAQGFVIDAPIMVQGYPPFMVMSFRKQLGVPWDAPLGKPQVIVSPGPGQTVTDFSQKPSYAIPTSTDLADYPPADPPAPPTPTPTASPIGAFAFTDDLGRDVYFVNPDNIGALKNGDIWPNSSASPRYELSIKSTPFGPARKFTQVG